MMDRRRLCVLIAAAVLFASAPASARRPKPTPVVLNDQIFAQRAAAAGLAEIELSELAEKKASSAAVKKYAQMLVKDHTAADAELKKLADKEKIKLPAKLTPEAQAVADKLKKLSGAAFDRAYVQQMVLDHGAAIALFGNAAKQLKGGMQSFAQKMLPKLHAHMQEAQKLAKQL